MFLLLVSAITLASADILCPKCGVDNADEASFCKSCGTALKAELVCPECGHKSIPGAKFCAECGAKLPQKTAPRQGDRPPASASAGDVWICPADGAEMVYVPAGEFLMGSADGDKDADYHEHPQRRVHLDAFWMYKTEVTVAQYRRFCQAAGRKMPEPPSWGWKDDHPVVNVSWERAAAYARWAGKRLPTEAEWEKAARGTDGRKYPWGDGWPPPRDAGNFADMTAKRKYTNWPIINGYDDGYAETAPVGSFLAGASPYGCLDLAGNVWEWCSDWYGEKYYSSGPTRNPKGLDSGLYRVLRGGGWNFGRRWVRCAYRTYYDPSNGNAMHGFRCARDSE